MKKRERKEKSGYKRKKMRNRKKYFEQDFHLNN
jgi:hypothetical protein